MVCGAKVSATSANNGQSAGMYGEGRVDVGCGAVPVGWAQPTTASARRTVPRQPGAVTFIDRLLVDLRMHELNIACKSIMSAANDDART